ncbi:MAG: SDR family oxidoreductase [Tolypothrix carrinoi HA7290-LM1]|jgi:3-oxoacyl-[acyl-carrier protein] reductase|nr:SDR family oxidoreductase [Tolypothrix carrinoi HA7290-LM1]
MSLKGKVAIITGASQRHWSGYRSHSGYGRGNQGDSLLQGTKLPMPAGGLYAGSKAASELFTLCLSKELGARGVTVNNVSPGVTQTDGLILPPPVLEQLKQQTPLGRLGEPNDIANMVAFLVSEEGGWITSQTIQANGGLL